MTDWAATWRDEVQEQLRARVRAPRAPVRARMHQTTVFLEPEQRDYLRALAERLGVSVGALIREGIDMALRKEGL